jgi:exoribonuclease-2
MHPNQPQQFNLIAAARATMLENGFHPDFPAGATSEVAAIQAQPALPPAAGAQDLRSLLWSSIDNDTSKDLDQIEWAEQLPNGSIRVLVGVADVDVRVPRGTQLDAHAQSETTSVYTGVKVFPMFPTELSEGITSLNEDADRVALVIEFTVDATGTCVYGKTYRALVTNKAQLAYNAVGAWLEGRGPAPAKVAANADLAAQLKLQDKAAQCMVDGRFQHGALDLETIETRPLMQGDQPNGIAKLEKNRATSLIEEFMVAANGVIARSFQDAGVASIRRIVRTPKRWDRIVELAQGLGTTLPADPDSKPLNDFLLAQKQKDPVHFPDLSLAVVKLMGPGEYVLVKPNEVSPGHFGLAVQDYTH